MKFEKIIIPPGWQESFTKYPNGRTIFEALSQTITTVNEGIEEVNQKVNQGLLAIDQAENIIRQEITESFNTLKLQLEGEIDYLSSDIIADFALLQSEVLTLIAGKANAADVYTKQQVDAQLSEKAKAVDVYTKQQVDAQLAEKAKAVDVYTKQQVDAQLAEKALKTDVGLLSGLLTTVKTSIVNAINEIFNTKANKTQEAWITPTLSPFMTEYGSGYSTVQYYKDQFGIVHLKGTFNVTSTNVILFVLPVGYRPLENQNFVVLQNTSLGIIRVFSNGNVQHRLSSGTATLVSLDGITFKAEG